MMKSLDKILLTCFIIVTNFVFAGPPATPPGPPGGGGTGGTGPEAAASPIDMYIPFLIITAIVFTIWYVRRSRIKNA